MNKLKKGLLLLIAPAIVFASSYEDKICFMIDGIGYLTPYSVNDVKSPTKVVKEINSNKITMTLLHKRKLYKVNDIDMMTMELQGTSNCYFVSKVYDYKSDTDLFSNTFINWIRSFFGDPKEFSTFSKADITGIGGAPYNGVAEAEKDKITKLKRAEKEKKHQANQDRLSNLKMWKIKKCAPLASTLYDMNIKKKNLPKWKFWEGYDKLNKEEQNSCKDYFKKFYYSGRIHDLSGLTDR